MNIKVRTINEYLVTEVAKKYKLNHDLVRFLLKRHIPEKLIPLLINKDVAKLLPNNSISNVAKAAHLINSYLTDNSASIYIYGDYDCDGVNSTYIMYNALVELAQALESSVSINYYLPERTEGYGLNMNWCESIVSDNNNTLVITVDNGITKREEVEFLQAHNIDVLITDHHRPQEGLTPNAVIVDAHLHDEDNINGCGLCGAAVAYKIIAYLYQDIYEYDEMYVEKYVAHVGIATITDVMPVTQENIIFINNALNYLNSFPYTDQEYWPVTESMYYFAEMNKKSKLKPKDIAFGFGPQINSCGRMGNIKVAMDFMLSTDHDDFINNYKLMDNLNLNRKGLTKLIIDDIECPTLQDLSLVTVKKGIEGIAGSLASNLSSKYSLPTIIFTEHEDSDILTGSARSLKGYDIQTLFASTDYIESFGGHAYAAGVSIKKDNLQSFKESFNKAISKMQVSLGDISDETTYVDDILEVSDLNLYSIKKYDDILFFNALKRPIYYMHQLQVTGYHCSRSNPNNICFHIKNNNKEVKLWCWGFRETYEALGRPALINVVGSLEEFNKMLVIDIQQIEAA